MWQSCCGAWGVAQGKSNKCLPEMKGMFCLERLIFYLKFKILRNLAYHKFLQYSVP